MKQWQKICSAALAAVLACGVFAGCTGGGDDNGGTPGPGPGPEPEPTYFTVTYNANGGTMTADASVEVEEGESVTLPSAVLDGFDMTGWYLGSTLVGEAGASYTPTGDVTLTAQWEEIPVVIDYAQINYERAVGYAKLINKLYWNSDTNLSQLTPEGGAPYLWPFTEQVSMVNGILLTMDENDADRAFFETYLEELIVGLRHYRVSSVDPKEWENADHYLAEFGETDGTANSYAIYNSGRFDGAIDSVNASTDGIFFDDNVWVAKEFYYAYVNTGKEAYFNEAVNILNWIVGEGYESTEGLNGIYWKWGAKFRFEGDSSLNDNTHASLNACSSAPTSMMLAKVYQTMKEAEFAEKFAALAPEYLSKAQNIYEFCYSVLRNPTNGCLRDKIFLREGFEEMTNQSQQIQLYDEQILPYNTGTFMTAGAELYNVAVAEEKDLLASVYLDRNTEVAADADRQFTNTQVVEGQYSYHSNSWFTSFLLEGFIDLSASVPECDEYIEHMRSALDYAWNNNRSDDGLVCPAWISGWSSFTDNNPNSENNPRQILLQSANAHCYAMLARYYAQ